MHYNKRAMKGIDLNKEIKYEQACFRFFKQGERHISRVCSCDVIVFVFEGVLRFTENGVKQEVKAGEYYIQQMGSIHGENDVSDSPKYLWIHFYAAWDNNEEVLPYKGKYNYEELKPYMEEIDKLSHENAKLVFKNAVMNCILAKLAEPNTKRTRLHHIVAYMKENYFQKITLESLSVRFNFSKNQIINIFNREYGVTPMQYLLHIRLENAKRYLLVTAKSADEIAFDCGFSDYSHLYKNFIKLYHCSPSDWRKKNLQM